MNKRLLLALFVAFAAAFSLMAEGQQDRLPFDEEDEVTLTGTLDLSGFGPVLVTEEGSFLLMTGPVLPEGLEAEHGDEITVEGFLAPDFGRNRPFGLEHFMVTAAIVDGVKYEFDHYAGGMMGGYGWDDGRMGGRGGMMGRDGGYYGGGRGRR